MKIIISPAKTMIDTSDDFVGINKPQFIEKANRIYSHLQSLDYDALKNILNCNDKICELNYHRLQNLHPNNGQLCAVMTYKGLQYQHMAPSILDDASIDYLNHHLVILSGLYGALYPNDAIIEYRLEMQASIAFDDVASLYDYWSDDLLDLFKNELIINLASKEYSDVLKLHNNMVNIHFKEYKNGKLVSKATLAKMARGAMVRYMAENKVETLEQLKNFSDFDFKYHHELSDNNNLIFVVN